MAIPATQVIVAAETLTEELITEAVYQWNKDATDWVDIETGELLTGYEPDANFRDLVESKIILAKSCLEN